MGILIELLQDGKGLEPLMIKLGQQVYREYQRQLWDPLYDEEADNTTDEFHYHKVSLMNLFIPILIFLNSTGQLE